MLIQGESGTGKELLARAIHQAQRAPLMRPSSPSTVQPYRSSCWSRSCSATSKGPSQVPSRPTRGCSSPQTAVRSFWMKSVTCRLALQAKLLRVLEDKEVRPLGSSQSMRWTCGSCPQHTRMLEQAIAEGTFREDLYYRLNVVNLVIPPLRERREDIPCSHTISSRSCARSMDAFVNDFTPDAMEMLTACDWPGNVRQLMNVVEQCCALSTGPLIPASWYPAHCRKCPWTASPMRMPSSASSAII